MAQFYNLLLFLSLCVALPPVSPLFSLFYLSSHPGFFPLSLATLSSTSPVLPLLNSRLLPRFWFHYIGRKILLSQSLLFRYAIQFPFHAPWFPLESFLFFHRSIYLVSYLICYAGSECAPFSFFHSFFRQDLLQIAMWTFHFVYDKIFSKAIETERRFIVNGDPTV